MGAKNFFPGAFSPRAPKIWGGTPQPPPHFPAFFPILNPWMHNRCFMVQIPSLPIWEYPWLAIWPYPWHPIMRDTWQHHERHHERHRKSLTAYPVKSPAAYLGVSLKVMDGKPLTAYQEKSLTAYLVESPTAYRKRHRKSLTAYPVKSPAAYLGVSLKVMDGKPLTAYHEKSLTAYLALLNKCRCQHS